MNRTLHLAALCLLVAACGNRKFDIAINAGPAGADVARMAASEVRQSRAAKDKRVDVRIAAMRATARTEATPQLLAASLDSMLDDEHVGAVISRFLDQELLAKAQEMKQKRIPFLSTTPVPPGVVSGNGPGFSLVPGYAKQAAFLAQQASASDRIAIVHINDFYGNTLATELANALKARGLNIADIRKYDQSWDEPRMVALGTEMLHEKEPTLLFFIGRAPSLELVWQPFHEALKEIRVIGSDLVESTALYLNDEAKFTGLRYVRFFDPQSPNTRMKDLHDRYAMWIGRGEMTGEAVFVYDAMLLIGDALRSGARTHDEIIAYLASLGKSRPPFNGVGGLIAFGSDGECERKFELAEVTDRGIIPAKDAAPVAMR